MNIYEISKEFEAIHRAIDDADGEITEEVESWLNALEDKTDEALSYMAQEITNLEGHARLVSQEAMRLSGRAQSMRNGAKRLREAIAVLLHARNITRKKTLTHHIALSQTKHLEIYDLSEVESSGFVELIPKPDKKAIKEAIGRGLEVPGARIVLQETVRLSVGREVKEDDDE